MEYKPCTRTPEQAAKILSDLIACDSEAMRRLATHRVPCNLALADHPTCQVGEDEERGGHFVGLIGILNAIFGETDEERPGRLWFDFDEQNRLVGVRAGWITNPVELDRIKIGISSDQVEAGLVDDGR